MKKSGMGRAKILKEPLGALSLKKVLRRAFGSEARNATTQLLKGGLYNTSYKIVLRNGTRCVLRIAPSRHKPLLGFEKDLLKRETYFLGFLKDREMPVPRILHEDFSGTILPRDWVILELCEGQNAVLRLKTLTASEKAEVSADWGDLAGKIHAIRNAEGWFGPPAPVRRHETWSGFIQWYVRSLCDDLRSDRRLRSATDFDLADAAVRAVPALEQVCVPRLVHGDLSPGNILIAKKHGRYRITAILDWDRGVWGDPWFEWILHGWDLGPVFWEHYGIKPLVSTEAKIRTSLYKTCGCLHAALEESIHFGKMKEASQMMEYFKNNSEELTKLLRENIN